jgi:trans-2,3-dihydro-3-hydroxyanthranilate isomerase
MRQLHYRRLDVFTNEQFGGNPLAVFLNGAGLQTSEMQKIARELNLSESVFVSPVSARANEWRLRIFTPSVELPFAGHPTIGTAIALVLEGYLGTGSRCRLVLHEPVGPIQVCVHRTESTANATFFVLKLPEFGQENLASAHFAAILGLSPDEILEGLWRPRAVSCGVPFYFVAVKDLSAIKRIQLRFDLWEKHLSSNWAPHLYVITTETELPESQIHARMFAPAMGVSEDPATGGAVAALSGYLAEATQLKDGHSRWQIEQGFELGRPSLIGLDIDTLAGHVRSALLTGSATPMGRGVLELI